MNRLEWNKLVIDHAPPFGAFLQSWQWGEFQQALGRQVERIFIEEDKFNLIAQAIKMDLPLGQYYWYMPKGPLGTMAPGAMAQKLKQSLKDGIFYRCEPTLVSKMVLVNDVQPANTILLDLTLGEEALLSGMKSKTRYNIRLAQRKGVICKFVGLENFDDFMRLMEQTVTRDKFKAHPAVYYQTMLKSLVSGEVKATLAAAFYENHMVAANLILDFGETRTYLHGATSNLHRNVMAQYALHWFLIKDAMMKGFKTFDFWGVAPEDASTTHFWAGISRYKRAFGGRQATMPGTYDLPLAKVWYSLYRFVRKIRH